MNHQFGSLTKRKPCRLNSDHPPWEGRGDMVQFTFCFKTILLYSYANQCHWSVDLKSYDRIHSQRFLHWSCWALEHRDLIYLWAAIETALPILGRTRKLKSWGKSHPIRVLCHVVGQNWTVKCWGLHVALGWTDACRSTVWPPPLCFVNEANITKKSFVLSPDQGKQTAPGISHYSEKWGTP